jgi:hypothetical protein
MVPPTTARQRLDAHVHLAKLASSARLFLVAVMAFGVLAHGFLIGDLGRLGFDLQVVALLHLFQGDAQMQVAQAP